MKPLLQTQLSAFLKRFENFKDADFRSLQIISPTNIKLTLAVQDSARAYDWITITLEFNGVSDARLVEENQLSFLDMSEGVSLLALDNKFAFGISECYNISSIKNSSCYLVAESIKYEEGQF
jgi:hypothetical protein